jgi:hypothetical protein
MTTPHHFSGKSSPASAASGMSERSSARYYRWSSSFVLARSRSSRTESPRSSTWARSSSRLRRPAEWASPRLAEPSWLRAPTARGPSNPNPILFDRNDSRPSRRRRPSPRRENALTHRPPGCLEQLDVRAAGWPPPFGRRGSRPAGSCDHLGMPPLGAKERAKLSNSAFAEIDSGVRRRLLIQDAAPVGRSSDPGQTQREGPGAARPSR